MPAPNAIFDAPIPGQSLTQEPGATPMEQPPQFADIDAALEFLLDKLTQKRQAVRLVLMLKKGITAEYIAKSILFDGFSRGKWSPDLAMLMLRIVMAMIIAIGTNAGVKDMKVLNPDINQDKFLDQFLTDGAEGNAELDASEGTQGESDNSVPNLPQFKGLLGSIA